ncbi:hypothetical protein CFN17_17185 [Arthrobacter sp. PM3]|nr:hypothetical protein CFN17_17185 [Arthrobacter sp. PM3]
MTAEISQFRDNYSKQIIEIQLTNTTGGILTVLGAELNSPLFSGPITWPAQPGGIQLPPGQTKSLPAPLPAPDCATPAAASAPVSPSDQSGAPAASAHVSLRLSTPAGTVPGPQSPTPAPTVAAAAAADPFGVLARNNAELCLRKEAAAVATIMLDPNLEASPDGRTAVVRLLITPTSAGTDTAGGAAPGELVIQRIDETTLLAQSPAAPWPRMLTLRPGGPAVGLPLSIRPARCDPHSVAEDKVGTLLPLRVSVAGREGVLKIDAGDKLRARIYDFVTTACGRQ